MSWGEFHIGLPRPKTADEMQRQTELNGMRQAIWDGMYNSHLIRNCIEAARHQGLNGEDTYTLLAYHALLLLEESFQREMKRVALSPDSPFKLLKEEDLSGR